MKMKIKRKKLTLNKTTIAALDSEKVLRSIKGGIGQTEKSRDDAFCTSMNSCPSGDTLLTVCC